MIRFRLFAAASMLAALSSNAIAQPEIGKLIDGVASAYGGAALQGIKNYRISERYLAPATGQSWSPELVNIGAINQQLIHDMNSGNVYFENWASGRSGIFPTVTVVNGEDAFSLNLQNNSYGDAASSDPYVIAGGTMRTTDTLLALELLKSRDSAKLAGSAKFLNREYDLVTIPFPSSPELTLYVDRETRLIGRMTRVNPQLGPLDYVYHGHQEKNGIVRATRINFFVDGDANLIGAQRSIVFNEKLPADQFALPDKLEREAARFTDTDMVVNRLSANAYHIGQGGAYSVFIDTDDGLIASGGYAGLTQRLKRFREETGNHRPLRYLVVTHHHSDHLGGIGEAVELGATLVTVAGNVEAIADASGRELEDSRVLRVQQRLTLGSGKRSVELYDVSTIHAASNLLVHLPGERSLFMADHFGSPYQKGAPVANNNTMSMSNALAPLSLDYNKIVTAHSGRVYSDSDFAASVKAFRDFTCPENRPLCKT